MSTVALRVVLLGFLSILCSVVPAARADDPPTGVIAGTVTDEGGLSIPGALLTLSAPELLGGSLQTSTDGEGAFRFSGLPPARYTLLAQKQGFGATRKDGLVVVAGTTTRVAIELAYAGEQVVVVASPARAHEEADPPPLSADFLSRIPAGRSYQSATPISAGVVAGRGSPLRQGRPPPAAPPARDRYGRFEENPVQAVADRPLSTFAIDVDTASYTNVRRYLREGTLPPPDAVRIEELVNYFAYADAPPTDGSPFAVRTDVATCPWAPDHRLLRVALRGRDPSGGAPPSRNLVFLVDVSGSMAGPDRLQLVQRGLDLLVGQLGPRDHVALVTYAGAAGIALPPTPGDQGDRIRDAIWSLGAGGSTAGAEGIRTAYDLARRTFEPDGINRVILATDGDFNVGVSGPAALEELIVAERDGGVFLSVLGVGRGNLQDDALEALADKGNGTYAYLDGASELRKVFATEVAGTLETIAKDVKIQVEFNPALVAGYRLLGYENRALADRDFADDAKDAGELGAGHAVTALYELVPAGAPDAPDAIPLRYRESGGPTAAAASDELATVSLRYKEPAGSRSTLLSVPVTDDGARFEDAGEDLRWAAAVAAYGMVLRGSPNRGEADWGLVARLARDAVGDDPHGYRAELVALIAQARGLGPSVASGH